jgi:hypothetical protein
MVMGIYEKTMYNTGIFFDISEIFLFFPTIILVFPPSVKKKCGSFPLPHFGLLLAERLAVGTLIHSGIGLMGTHQNPIQGAVVLAVAVVSALLNGAFDALVCMAIHSCFPPLFWVLW